MDLKPVKLVLLGETGVGKTSIIQRFVYDDFREDPQPTIGANFTSRVVKPPGAAQSIRFHVWDTAGSEVYRSLIRMYYRDATVAVLVYDTTNYESFERLKYWQKKLHEESSATLVLAVVGNKSDLHEREAVKLATAMSFAQKHDAIFSLCSAKEAEGVEEVFTAVARKLLDLEYWKHDKFLNKRASMALDTRTSISVQDHEKKRQAQSGCKSC